MNLSRLNVDSVSLFIAILAFSFRIKMFKTLAGGNGCVLFLFVPSIFSLAQIEGSITFGPADNKNRFINQPFALTAN